MIVVKTNPKFSSHSRFSNLGASLVPLALVLALGALPKKGEAASLEVKIGKTVEITSSHRYCWFPTVHRFHRGDLMVTMRMSPDEYNPEGDFSAYCISKDGGVTWSRRYTMGSGANVDAAWSTDPEKDGKIWQLYGWVERYPPGQDQNFYLTLTKYSRSGMEFQQWRDIPLHFSEPILEAPTVTFDRRVSDGHLKQVPVACPWGTIIHGRKGGLLALAFYKTVERRKYFREVLICSHDEGKTWEQRSVVATVGPEDKPLPWMGDEGPNEGSLVRLADGRLLAVFRTGRIGNTGEYGNIGETWSSDDGKSWTPPIAAPFKGVAPRLRRLSSGILALTTGRPDPVEVFFSVDGSGEKWTGPTTVVENHPHELIGGCTHYTDFVEVDPGKLLVVYDEMPYGSYAIPYADRTSKNIIYGTFVEVHKK